VAVALCLVASCGGGPANARGALVVRLEDFKVHLATGEAQPGAVIMHLINDGPSTHELNVDRTDLPADQLPLRADGLSVAEDSPLLTRMGSIEVLQAGDTAELDLELPPGHYVVYCNLEGHYLGRMYADLVVP
jgi:uncharacterized cupredoxin-like copper-binding protein